MNAEHKTPENARAFVSAVAAHQGFSLARDEKFLDAISKGLAENYNRYGYYLCPCRDGEGEREADADIICPCDYNLPDQKEYGHCFCGLFLTKAFAESGKPPASIPERRPGGF